MATLVVLSPPQMEQQIHTGPSVTEVVPEENIQILKLRERFGRFQKFVDDNLSALMKVNDQTDNETEKMFGWIYELRDRECNEIKNFFQSWAVSEIAGHSLSADGDILKLRKQLFWLQIKMPAWNQLDCIARAAQFLKEDDQVMSDNDQITFVQNNVEHMLGELYSRIDAVVSELGDTENSELKKWVKKLYKLEDGNVYPVGPVGERPIHVCAFAVLKYRSTQKNIATGILNGMLSFIKDKRSGEQYSHYGKDYCAALGSLGNDHDLEDLPYFECVQKWLKAHQDVRIKGLGIYEGETIHFPLVAGNESAAVKILLDIENSQKESSKFITDIKAKGLFFRPMYNEPLASFSRDELWQWYWKGSGEANLHSSSSTSYFGFDLLSFAVSQGQVQIFDIIFDHVHRHAKHLLKSKRLDLEQKLKKKIEEDSKDPSNKGGQKSSIQVIKELLPKNVDQSLHLCNEIAANTWDFYSEREFLEDDFIRRAIVNRKDEFGNTMLHLAAWNSKEAMYDRLIQLGADPLSQNKDGLTAFTLSVRFGRWTMYKHIFTRHFTTPYWKFGNVKANIINRMQFETGVRGLGTSLSARDIDKYLELLVLKKIAENLKHQIKISNGQEESYPASPDLVNLKIRSWCEKKLGHVLTDWIFKDGKESKEDKAQHVNHTPRIQKFDSQFKDATTIITFFRPKGWYESTKTELKKSVHTKWSRGYYLVHLADTVIPYCVLLLLFGLMFWQRKLSILKHNFWWSDTLVAAPISRAGIESACGWKAIRDSHSGRLQATLIVYGVPSLLRLAMVQSRLKPSDLDEDLNWKISVNELVNFIFMNLESLFHVIIAGFFITIGSARVAAQTTDDIYHCDISSLRTEKNITSLAALALFFNLFIICKPYRGLGVLVQTMYRFLIKEIFNFLVMYSMLFVAFLLALQTLHNANSEFLTWMDTSPEILPLVSRVQNLTYLVNNNIPEYAATLGATETALDGCWSKRRTIRDTAFSLLEISFGDGLADAIEQARTKPFECAGFTPDFLIGYLLVFWVFVTNILFLNMMIAVMNKTFDAELERISSKMLLDQSYRIIRYEMNFPEVSDWIRHFSQPSSLYTRQFWVALLLKVLMVLYCLPEIHFLVFLVMYMFPSHRHVQRQSDDIFKKELREALCMRKRVFTLTDAFADLGRLKENLGDYLDGGPQAVIELLNRTKLRYDPQNTGLSGETHAETQSKNHPGRRLDELICRLEAIRSARSTAKVEVAEDSEKVSGDDAADGGEAVKAEGASEQTTKQISKVDQGVVNTAAEMQAVGSNSPPGANRVC